MTYTSDSSEAKEAAEAASEILENAGSFINLTEPVRKAPIPLSADAVAREMDKLIADGRLSATEKGLVLWLVSDAKEKGESLSEIGQHIRFSPTTISRFLRGQYEGNLSKVISAIRSYKNIIAERSRMSSAEFIETSIWTEIRSTCDFAVIRHRPCRIVGVSQIGKTAALKEYQRRSEYLVRYARLPAAAKFRTVVEIIAEACGISASASTDHLRRRVANALDSNSLLIIDELHELAISSSRRIALDCIEWFREIYDTRGCGMILCGTRAMEEDLFAGPQAGWLNQLDQRCARITHLPNRLTDEDISLIARTYALPAPEDDLLLALRGLSMSRLTLSLQLATEFAARRSIPITWDLVRSAINSIRGTRA